MNSIARFWLYGVVTLLCGPLACAQVLEKDVITVPVKIEGRYTSSYYWEVGLGITLAGVSTDQVTDLGSNNYEVGVNPESSPTMASLKPGEIYSLYVSKSSNATNAAVQLSPPPGYRVYIDDVRRSRITEFWGNPVGFYNVRVEAEEVLPFGKPSSLRAGRVVWSVGLGNLSNGRSAGSISVRRPTSSGYNIQPTDLIYDSANPEFEVTNEVSGVRQIYVTNGLAEIYAPTSTSTRLRFYRRVQVGSKVNGLYTLTGNPLYEYVIGPSSSGVAVTKVTDQGNATRSEKTELTPIGSPLSLTRLFDWGDSQSWPAAGITIKDTDSNGTTTSGNGTSGSSYSTSLTGVAALERRQYDENGQLVGRMRLLNNSWFYDKTWGYENGVSTGETSLDPRQPKSVGISLYEDVDRKWQPSARTEYYKDTASGKVTSFDYEADWTGRKTLLKSSSTVVGSVTLAKSEVTYSSTTIADSSRTYQGSNALPAQIATRRDYYDATHYLTTVTKSYRDDADPQYRFFPGMTHSIKRPDGTMTVNLFFRGTFSLSTREFSFAQNGPEVMKLTLNGTTSTTGTSLLTSYTRGTQEQPTDNDFRVMPNVSTAQAVFMAADGTIICSQSMIYDGTDWPVIQRDVHEYVDQFFLASTTRDSGNTAQVWPIVTNTWSAGRLTASVDEFGIRTEYTYDVVGRVATKTRIGASGQGATVTAAVTTFEYDAANNVTKETVSASGTSETLVTTRTFDQAGRLVSEAKPGTGTTTITYQNSMTGPRQLTTTLPSGSTIVDDYFLDGRPKQKEGTGAVATSYTYATETDGRESTTVTTGTQSQTSWIDMLGRKAGSSRPGFTGQSANVETFFYDDYNGGSTGRLMKTTRTGFGPTLMEYNSMSQVIRQGIDLDGSQGLHTNSPSDRVTGAGENFVFDSSDDSWWVVITSTAYPFVNSDTGKIISKVSKRLTKLTSTLRAETRTLDAEGNETRVTISVDAANKLTTVTTKRPGMIADAVEKSLNGLPIETTGHDGLAFKKRYDLLSRLNKEIEPRTGTESVPTVTTTYTSGTALPYEKRDTTNRILAKFTYDTAGRVIKSEDAIGKTTRTSFTARGEVQYVWGSGTYPISYVYSTMGQKTAMRTYRDPENVSAADSATFPNLTVYDETTWTYDGPSGLLTKKTDAKGKFVEYTYNARGQTLERHWSRFKPGSTTERVKATFAYFGDGSGEPQTGELKSISYNDATPTVSHTYTRSGQADSITDFTGTRDLIYDSGTSEATAKPWRLSAEVLDIFYGSRALSPSYDTALSTNSGALASHTLATVPGRLAGIRLGTLTTPTADLEFAYPISNVGRVAGVTSARGSATRTFTYGYEPNSSLLKSLGIAGGHPFTITRDFETVHNSVTNLQDPTRDLVVNVEAKWSTATRTKFAYVYDDRRQRKSVVQGGDVFNDYGGTDGGAIHQIFTYNGRGEVTGAGTFLGATADDQTLPLSARKHEFDYDGIGNRKWSNTSGVTGTRDYYTTNEANQYVLRENNTLAVGGVADADAKVAVRYSAQAGRAGNHWGDNLTLDNWTYPFQGNIAVYAVNSTANTKEILTRAAYLPPAAQAMTYDADGNITADGVWTYEWDAENRLVAMQTTANAIAGGVSAQRLEFKYDYMHRRVEKAVYTGTSYSTLASKRRYLYDGWSMIAEFSVSGSTLTTARTYTWGLDIAKSLTDAGGVGALLQIHDHTVGGSSGKDYLPSYDGNGNVAALFDADTANSGRCVAAYEYSPYGEFLRCEVNPSLDDPEKAAVAAQPFRFSTKFFDGETGLVYYGRRYYSPSQGRFLGRDPIEEQGGLNLYGFCGNNAINGVDALGLSTIFTINGARYTVIPVPIQNSYNYAYVTWARSQGGMVTINPSNWNISLGAIWSPANGFTLVGSASNWAYVAIPVQASATGAISSATVPSSVQRPQVPTPVFNASNTLTVDRLIAHMNGGGLAALSGVDTMMFYNPEATGNATFNIADGRHFSATADAFRDHGLVSPATSYSDLISSLGSSYYKPSNVGTLVLVDHGNPGGPQYAGTMVDDRFFQAASGYFGFGTQRTIIFFGCAVGEQWEVVELMAQYAQRWNLVIIMPNQSIRYSLTGGMIPTAQNTGLNWIRLSPGTQGAQQATLDAFGNPISPSTTIPFNPSLIPASTGTIEPLPPNSPGVNPPQPVSNR